MKTKMLTAVVALLALSAATAEAAKIDKCASKLPADVATAAADFRACLTAPPAAGAAGAAGGAAPAAGGYNPCAAVNGLNNFLNNEGYLPAAPKGTIYREARVGAAAGGTAGVRRLVFLVITGGAKPKVDAQYFTPDHYKTFCRMN